MKKLITARARKNKRTTRMLGNSRKDQSISLTLMQQDRAPLQMKRNLYQVLVTENGGRKLTINNTATWWTKSGSNLQVWCKLGSWTKIWDDSMKKENNFGFGRRRRNEWIFHARSYTVYVKQFLLQLSNCVISKAKKFT